VPFGFLMPPASSEEGSDGRGAQKETVPQRTIKRLCDVSPGHSDSDTPNPMDVSALSYWSPDGGALQLHGTASPFSGGEPTTPGELFLCRVAPNEGFLPSPN